MAWQLYVCRHDMSCHVMSCHVMSCHVMSCDVMSCHVMTGEEPVARETLRHSTSCPAQAQAQAAHRPVLVRMR